MDLPGHPDGLGLTTIDGYEAWVDRYLHENRISEPVVIGHSMGGAIAIEHALKTNGVKGLVLVGTGARLRVREDLLKLILENYEEASKIIAKLSVSPNCNSAVVERIAREMLKVNPKVTYGDFAACNAFDRIADIGRIRARTLVIHGADDQLTPPKYSKYLHEKIANSKLVTIPGAGHSVMLEKHREFNGALEEFLASL